MTYFMLKDVRMEIGIASESDDDFGFLVLSGDHIHENYTYDTKYLIVVNITDDTNYVHGNGQFFVNSVDVKEVYSLDNIEIYSKFGIEPPNLKIAIKNGHFNLVKKLVTDGANLYENGLLDCACIYNQYEIVEYLLNNGITTERLHPLSFMDCIISGYTKLIKLLLENGLNLSSYPSCLHYACVNGHIEIVKLLLEYGVDINEINKNTLQMTRNEENVDVISYLVEKGIYIGSDYVFLAIMYAKIGNLQMLKTIIDKGLDISLAKNDILDISILSGQLEIVKFALEIGANIAEIDTTTFVFCCLHKHYHIVRYLIENGLDIQKHERAFLYCLRNCDFETAEYFLKCGFSFDKFDNVDCDFYSSVHDIEIAHFLTRYGIDLHCHNEIFLMNAIKLNKLDFVKFLVEDGADIQIEDNKALRLAVEYDRLDILKYLYENGADIFANNNYAIRRAVNDKNNRMIDFLVEKGAVVGM